VVTVSELAEREIRQVLTGPENAEKFIRIRVTSGGCAGYNYDVVLDNTTAAEDETVEGDGYRVIYDEFTRVLIDGSRLDFNDGLIGRGFTLENPNALVTCGCGTSFNVKPRRSPLKNMRPAPAAPAE
jgi:iron-sulfur cluster assembly accessory protein